MASTLIHRGPDGFGLWKDDNAGIALAHRRLAILDLSPTGEQPMKSSCGQYVLCYNGEVYNAPEMRAELEDYGHAFRGTSDTEVLLTAIAHYGLKPALNRCVGMFAFALWNLRKRTLTLARDRLGIKPLYYTVPKYAGDTLIFASELKALRAHPDFQAEIDPDSLALFFRHNYVPDPHCILKGVRKLPPGTLITLGEANGTAPKPEVWWSAEEVWQHGATSPFLGSREEMLEELDQKLLSAVSMRLLSDVPLGAFLSGGIDSSLVAAYMRRATNGPVRTFTIGFNEQAYDESEHARAVAEHLGTEHTSLTVTPGDMLRLVPRLPEIWDEPFGDSSQFATLCVSQMAREHVTVCLSGDGGDELFWGYDRYFETERMAGKLLMLPRALRRLPALFTKNADIRTRWRGLALTSRDLQELYRYVVSHHKEPTRLVPGAKEPKTPLSSRGDMAHLCPMQQMSLWDVQTYLPGDILTKLDRASMAVGLEARVPLLDHRIVEFAARISPALKACGSTGKLPLRQLLERHVPRELFDRPKKGFSVPIAAWLQNELREWASDMLSPEALKRDGLLNESMITTMWSEQQQGSGNWHYLLWDILMFRAWMETWR